MEDDLFSKFCYQCKEPIKQSDIDCIQEIDQDKDYQLHTYIYHRKCAPKESLK